MIAAERLNAIVHRLVQARQTGQPLPAEALDPTLTSDEAYAIQAGVAQALGWFPQGPRAWKVGGTTVISAAPLPDVLSSPATWSGSGDEPVLVEAELAFRLARTPESPEDILGCLGTVCVSIETIATRLHLGLQAPAAWKLADQGVHGGLVIGPEQPCEAFARFTDADWRQVACRIHVNGQLLQQAQGSHPALNPLSTLPWLVTHAAAYTGGLRAGDLITTGAWLVVQAQAGDEVVVDVDRLAPAHLRIGVRVPPR